MSAGSSSDGGREEPAQDQEVALDITDPSILETLRAAPSNIRKTFGDLALTFRKNDTPQGTIFQPTFGRFSGMEGKLQKLVQGVVGRGNHKMQEWRELLLNQLLQSRVLAAFSSLDALKEYKRTRKKLQERVVLLFILRECTSQYLDDPTHFELGWKTLRDLRDDLISSGQDTTLHHLEEARASDFREEKVMVVCELRGLGPRESQTNHIRIFLINPPDKKSFLPPASARDESREELLARPFK